MGDGGKGSGEADRYSPFCTRRNSGLLHVCTRGIQHKAQEEHSSSVA